MKKKDYLWAGIVGGFTATTCCITPIVLVLLGFGTALGMAFMHQFHIVSIVSGVILMLLISLYLIKRRTGACNVKTMRQNWLSIVTSLVIMVVSLLAINYLVIGPLADKVYGDLPVAQKPLGNLEEMAESHGMPTMAALEVIPEGEGNKLIVLELEGLFCGSCGPAIEYDLKSIEGVFNVEKDGTKYSIKYDSDVTSKDIIAATIHSPYAAKILSEEVIGYS